MFVKITFESRVFRMLAAPSLSTYTSDVGLLRRKLRNRKGGKKDRNWDFPLKFKLEGNTHFAWENYYAH